MKSNTTPTHRIVPERGHVAYFTAVFLLCLGMLFVLSYVAISLSGKQARRQLLAAIEMGERQAVESMRREAQATLLDVSADLLTFRAVYERYADDDPRESVEQFLLDFMQSHRSYDQIRFLGPDGVEQIRVDNERDGARLLPLSELQDKSGTAYFARARSLGRQQLLIMPLDVNRERGEIELPVNPVIRVLARVSDGRGNDAGVIVLNYRAAFLLDSMQSIGQAALGTPLIVNGPGVEALERLRIGTADALLRANAALTFAQRYPGAWSALQQGGRGLIDDGFGGVMVAERFQPSAITVPATIGAGLTFTLPMDGAPEREGHWFIISHLDAPTLAGILRFGLRPSTATIGLLALLMTALAWFVALRFGSYRSEAVTMRRLATTDALTGILNRGEFERRARRAMARAQRYNRPMALLYVDLDGFKTINDERGHAVGDSLLRHAASALQSAVRNTDFVGRMGGDEFAVVLTEVRGRNDTKVVAEKLRQHLNSTITLAGHQVAIGGSVGEATFPEDAEDADGLFESADRAMYREKQRRNPSRGAAA